MLSYIWDSQCIKGGQQDCFFKEFPQLKKKLWGVRLWNPSYFVVTINKHTEAQNNSTFKITN
ncbi:transposase [Paenibacillus sp. N3/727]|uniref:transposase n=1 Tax=Paenibacillus sp. N3/727 TaxID=2925845 RepID=UPI001F53B697|nr:transposase [Paenibacillus sp. N3/727]UNK19060.1 transposase [Paenibacillus sp. N3/727]